MNNNSGEIFVLAVPESRKDEIEQVNNYHFYIPPALLEGNVRRIACDRQSLIEQKNLGWDVGFSSRLTVRAVNLSEEFCNDLIRWSQDSTLVFFTYLKGLEWINVLYSTDCRTKVDIRPDEESGFHHLCITVEPYRHVVPSSLLFTRDGNIVRLSDFVKYLV